MGKYKSYVAVAYFGKGASKKLPLKAGSVIIVNASEDTVAKGLTHPADLIELYNNGVHVFSEEHLHAKLFIIGNSLFVGSTNVSDNSADNLIEAVLKTADAVLIKQAKEFIKFLFGKKNEIGPSELKELQKIYGTKRPPNSKRLKSSKSLVQSTSPTDLYICHIDAGKFSDDEERQSKSAHPKARQEMTDMSHHILESLCSLKTLPIKLKDDVLQIFYDNNSVFVYPTATLIYTRSWANGAAKKTLYFLEYPKTRKIAFETFIKEFSPNEQKVLKSHGKCTTQLADKIRRFWTQRRISF